MGDPAAGAVAGSVDLWWLPLGAGGRCVALSGRLFEAAVAQYQHRRSMDLYHSALEVRLDGERYVVEMGPVWNTPDLERGVVCEGPVGLPGLGRWRLFRYEVRCWRGGRIPDAQWAVGGPQRMGATPVLARRILEVVPRFPTATWGLDEQGTGDMWNSNSLISWALALSGHDLSQVHPPGGGRAPGWRAGVVLAQRQGVLRGVEGPP